MLRAKIEQRIPARIPDKPDKPAGEDVWERHSNLCLDFLGYRFKCSRYGHLLKLALPKSDR